MTDVVILAGEGSALDELGAALLAAGLPAERVADLVKTRVLAVAA